MTTQISGSTGVSKVQDGVIVTADIADLAITPEKMSQKMTLMQSVDVTTLSDKTKCDFTGIPSWVKRITVMFSGVSTSGTSPIQVQLGAGSFATSGYSSTSVNLSGTPAGTNLTTGFHINLATAARSIKGHMVIAAVTSTLWTESQVFGDTGLNGAVGGGTVTLSGVLARLRITTVNGTDTFDAGSINIMYEG